MQIESGQIDDGRADQQNAANFKDEMCIRDRLNTIWAVVLPGAITANHVIIVRTFFQGIPRELTEAAAIDGCTNFKAFAHIVLPLSKAVVAVIALYVASSLWNGYFGPMIYLNDQDLYPLQLFLRQILLQNDMQGADISASVSYTHLDVYKRQIQANALQGRGAVASQ